MKLSYYASEKLSCPVCEQGFRREELHTGRGRLSVDKLTPELRHTYAPIEGAVVTPAIYSITVCPRCLYAAFKTDFLRTFKPGLLETIHRRQNQRRESMESIAPGIDFSDERTLLGGVVSYYYAMQCYDGMPPESCPAFRQALCALRAAWLLGDLHRQQPGNNWDVLMRVFYRKARFLYKRSLDLEEREQAAIPDDLNLGPDTDKNYGFDGILYIASVLELNWGPRDIIKVRAKNLEVAKMRLSRIFGLGKISKLKPSVLLEHSQRVFALVNKELQSCKSHRTTDDIEIANPMGRG